MKKWLIPLIVLTLSLAVAGIVTGFTLSGGYGGQPQDPGGQGQIGDGHQNSEEPSGQQNPIRSSDEGMDSEGCHWVHNNTACDGNSTLEDPPLPTYEDWLRDHGTDRVDTVQPVGSDESIDPGEWKVVTSIDDIEPGVCDGIHNINACNPEELEVLGMTPMTGSIAVGENHTGVEVEGENEPFFVDGEPRYEVQSHYETQSYEEATKQDCKLAGGTVYASSDGEVRCVIVRDLKDGGEVGNQAPPPTVIPQVLPSSK